jgi:hypothetical protein
MASSLRYYGYNRDQSVHNRIIELLTEIEQTTTLSVEVVRIRHGYTIPDTFPGSVINRRFQSQTVYEEDFERNRVLSENLNGRIPSGVFKTSNSRKIQIDGAIAVVDEDENVIWATENRSETDDPGSRDPRRWAINLLENIRTHGAECLTDLHNGDPSMEEQLIDRFVKQSPIEGKVTREMAVGRDLVDTSGITGNYENMITDGQPPREIDLVFESEDIYWIIEAKSKYNTEKFDRALGQAIVSAELFRLEQNLDDKQTQPAMLFGNTTASSNLGIQDELFSIASQYGIQIFVEDSESGFTQVTTNS